MNMHVSPFDLDQEWVRDKVHGRHTPTSVARRLGGVVSELTDEQVEQQRPGNRAWVLEQYQEVLRSCDAGSPEDPRWLDLKLKTLDRIGKILRVAELQGAREREGDVDRVRLVAAAAAALEALESKSRG